MKIFEVNKELEFFWVNNFINQVEYWLSQHLYLKILILFIISVLGEITHPFISEVILI